LGERQRDGALAGEVVDLVGLHVAHELQEVAEVEERRRVHLHALADAERLQALEALHFRVARAAMHLVAFLQEKSGEVCAVLSRDAENERAFHDVTTAPRISCTWRSKRS